MENVCLFVKEFESQVLEQLRLFAVDVALKENPTGWWVVHEDRMENWKKYRHLFKRQITHKTEEGECSKTVQTSQNGSHFSITHTMEKLGKKKR